MLQLSLPRFPKRDYTVYCGVTSSAHDWLYRLFLYPTHISVTQTAVLHVILLCDLQIAPPSNPSVMSNRKLCFRIVIVDS